MPETYGGTFLLCPSWYLSQPQSPCCHAGWNVDCLMTRIQAQCRHLQHDHGQHQSTCFTENLLELARRYKPSGDRHWTYNGQEKTCRHRSMATCEWSCRDDRNKGCQHFQWEWCGTFIYNSIHQAVIAYSAYRHTLGRNLVFAQLERANPQGWEVSKVVVLETWYYCVSLWSCGYQGQSE